MQPLSVEKSIWINAPRERVWQAITTPAQINQWWGGNDHWAFSALEVGAAVTFGYGSEAMQATIAVVDPPRQFSIKWPPQAQYHMIDIYTIYQLEEENGGTRVTVTETGFEALPDDIRQTRFDQTAKGYATVLDGLKAHVEGQ
jgi:uncharacterized protein YndB with AHSA1/START domain